MTYKILRFHVTKATRVIYRGLTLEQAQAHCHNPKTRQDGVWFGLASGLRILRYG